MDQAEQLAQAFGLGGQGTTPPFLSSTAVERFNEEAFRTKVVAALEQVRRVLSVSRNPTFAGDVDHKYQDKYLLAEWLVNSALVSFVELLPFISDVFSNPETFAKINEVSKSRTVTLRFESTRACTFLRPETRKEDSRTQHVTEISSPFGETAIKSKTVTTITEYFWKFTSTQRLFLFEGNDPNRTVELYSRTGHAELITLSDLTPHPEFRKLPDHDVDLTWIFSLISPDKAGEFKIDRMANDNRTPRRNQDAEEAMNRFCALSVWASEVVSEVRELQSIENQKKRGMGPGPRTSADVFAMPFLPVLPLFEDKKAVAGEGEVVELSNARSPLLEKNDLGMFVQEFKNSVSASLQNVEKSLPPPDTPNSLFSSSEGRLSFLLSVLPRLSDSLLDGLNYLESLLRKQLVAAIGKEVKASDLDEYMTFHNRKLFRPTFTPRPFCYDVRRSLQTEAPGDSPHSVAYSPEGQIAIERKQAHVADVGEPITTVRLIRDASTTHAMKFPVSAATSVSFRGPHYIHGYVNQSFSNEESAGHSLVARARQFSSFILMVGTISAADTVSPKHAVIVKDRDEVIIPLLLKPLPTAKESKDAISSLSPEQQRFAKAFREMQLESSLFAVLVVQVRPHLERLLRLPVGSLTKEVKLNQDLMELFLEYQLPSDLVCFSGDPQASSEVKLNAVKGHVADMFALLTDQKEKELEDQRKKTEAHVLNNVQHMPMPAGSAAPTFGQAAAMPRAGMPAMGGGGFFGSGSSSAQHSMGFQSRGMAFGGAPLPPAPPAMASPFDVAAAEDCFTAAALDDFCPQDAPIPESSLLPGASERQQQQEQQQEKPHEQQEDSKIVSTGAAAEIPVESMGGGPRVEDYTQLPVKMDKSFERLDSDAALRPTPIAVGPQWSRTRKAGLLDKPKKTTLGTDEQKTEKNRAFDLIDALTVSGALPLEDCALHVVVAATHCFDCTLMDAVVKKNANPIESVERSTLIVSSCIYKLPVPSLLPPSQWNRVKTHSPMLTDTEAQTDTQGAESALV
uniref:Uncharacterized protein n=1 Tax=Chromera velia CCMP2878 TaxID=1169474 RepID=A0A0G4FDD4_9ALVE|eukprot:Cvel_16467.t1-p1 / transcript=Cvel_16467.t1 / gene=Cvel_16467 / organism=Chromera_velia_CCMP2878 / gene_product=hypothetical protein / transcript_product=hypothetical protein / location=Cvel_scaffold1269:23676-28723(-) / protein_length=1021 / sequence_SO=supercontig / SO=protein_coding / is_pseudo=false